jgi:sulfate-transporting ATPase
LCDHIYVLDFGKLIAEGDAAAIRADRTVADAYLGTGTAHGDAEPAARGLVGAEPAAELSSGMTE